MEPAGDREDALDEYRAKRSFDRTPEPSGETAGGRDAGPRFVVQKHDARRLHYDFRLEADGVLVSWAVPKGPSYDPKAKRLAVHVEDHPLDYEDFEGVIPEAQYGAGTVIVWDRGTYRNLTEKRGRPVSVSEAVRAGHLSVWLDGTKLTGGWSLSRTRGYGDGDGDNWLLIKKVDDRADPARDVTADEPLSVKTGRDLRDTAEDTGSAQWTRERATWIPPLLDAPADGRRCIAVRNGAEIVLWSGDHQRISDGDTRIARALAGLAADNFTIDGLITDAGEYVPIDLLHLLGHDTTVLPRDERHALLAQTVEGAEEPIRPL
ncbi:MAG TPA: DNA polymerase ligase N-terminal domain-containing protein [Acidimicrobiales bacterium]|nr:DNA polymerase ligase N-terminal domain-containing protein [Acidimicrobiales bacterium]